MVKKIKRRVNQKKKAVEVHKTTVSKPVLSRNHATKKEEKNKNNINTFIFGHSQINKKDIIEIIIIIIFTAFLVFMHVKSNNII